MTKNELERSWKITTGHLNEARRLVADSLSPQAFNAFADWLAHNEFELALDELVGIFEGIEFTDVDAWEELLAASETMQLEGTTAYLRSKIDSLPNTDRLS